MFVTEAVHDQMFLNVHMDHPVLKYQTSYEVGGWVCES
jgi:hypothetical protein